MRILTVLESPSWTDQHIVGSLRTMGHDVVCFSYGSHVGEYYPPARHQEQLEKNRALLRLATSLRDEGGLDLIFCYVFDDFLLPEFAAKLAALNVAMVNFNVDMVNQWYRQLRTARYFTLMLCAQRANMDQLARRGKALYFPMAAPLPALVSDWQPAAPVTFVGTPMPFRTRVLATVQQANVPLAIYGKYWREQRLALPVHQPGKTLDDIRHYAWPRLQAEGIGALWRALRARLAPTANAAMPQLDPSVLHGFLPDDAMTALFRHSAVNLGFSRMVGDDPAVPGLNQVKLRDFEVPMAGGFYLVEAAPEYDQLFKPGIEVETWRTPGELIDKINYYLQHEAERRAIAAAGERRARAEHSWQARFTYLFNELGLAKK